MSELPLDDDERDALATFKHGNACWTIASLAKAPPVHATGPGAPTRRAAWVARIIVPNPRNDRT